jgi:hypothetical protein
MFVQIMMVIFSILLVTLHGDALYKLLLTDINLRIIAFWFPSKGNWIFEKKAIDTDYWTMSHPSEKLFNNNKELVKY